ncbi:MAG: DUF4922 domain-containing protein [Gemmatimonadetes bacterium]|nr:DUF4922 domain-containing protein [Gemmatimonadota bacterium]
MTWDEVLTATAPSGHDLRPLLDLLFAQAQDTWPLWRAGHDALHAVKVKAISDRGHRVLVQTNPGRSRSVHAAVDPASIAARPCFLCPENFPPGECGLAWRDLALLPNPHPIVERHLTIPSRAHEPQALAGRTGDLVQLARDLGEGMAVIYNGPRCGASAPDHFHFQACAATAPALELLPHDPPVPGMLPFSSFGRHFLALFDAEPAALAARIAAAFAAWGRIRPGAGEPLGNVLVRWQAGHGTALCFPRRAHRPAAFFAHSARRIAVSPAALEMAGILVVTDAESFERLDARAARTIYEDVSPTPQEFAAFLEQLL